MSTPADVPSVTPTVTLISGDGIVIRKPAFLCVLGEGVSAEFRDAVIALESAVAVPDRMPRRGRHLVRKLSELVLTADSSPDIAFAAPDSAGIAIYLAGKVFAEADGSRIEPTADQPFDRAIVWPYEGLGLYVTGAVPAEPGEEMFDLVEGVVPASGALLHTPLGLRGTEVHQVSAPARPEAGEPRRQASEVPEAPAPPEPPAAGPEPTEPFTMPPESSSSDGAAPVAPAADASLGNPRAVTEAMPTSEQPVIDIADPISAPEPPPAPEVTPGPGVAFRSDALGPPGEFVSAPLNGPAPDREPLAREPLGRAAPGRDERPPQGVRDVRPHAEPEVPAAPEKRAPLPKREHEKPATGFVKVESRVHVHGIRCSRGHLNHPQSWLCGVCGIRMDQLTAIMVEGERPPLGWLLLDNGSTYLLDEDLVIGREPGSPNGRAPGAPKPIQVPDETGQLSRRHVEIRLVEWTVQLVDLGSANGTFVVDPAGGNREARLPAQHPHVLVPGSHVRIGGRHFIFESPHARI